MVTILASIFVLGVLIIVHEYGHYWMAIKMGVGVEKFSIGFGKELYKKQVGETEFRVAWIPFGGYVKMVGDEEDYSPAEANGTENGEAGEAEQEEPAKPVDPEKAFNQKPVWRRFLIVAAGPVANLLFAIFIFALVFMIGVDTPDTRIKQVIAGSPAMAAGVMEGDRIIEINGEEILSWGELAEYIGESPDEPLSLTLQMDDGSIRYVTVTPEAQSAKTIFGEDIRVGRIGITPDHTLVRQNPIKAIGLGFTKTWEIIHLTGLVVVKMFQSVVPADTIGGPLMIFKVAGDKASEGPTALLVFMAVLSVNLGILNLLPIPVLDGGHILFMMIETLKGSPLSIRGREIAQQVGMFLLISLMAFAFYNDITRFLTGG